MKTHAALNKMASSVLMSVALLLSASDGQGQPPRVWSSIAGGVSSDRFVFCGFAPSGPHIFRDSLSAVTSAGPGAASAFSYGDFGLLKAEAGVAGDFVGSVGASVYCSANFEDFVVIDAPGLAGTKGSVLATLEVSHSVEASASFPRPGQESEASVYLAYVLWTNLGDQTNFVNGAFSAPPDPFVHSDLTTNFQAVISFTYGVPFRVFAQLDLETVGETSDAGARFVSSGFVTARWLGLTALPAHATVSQGRIDWTKPIHGTRSQQNKSKFPSECPLD